MAAAAEKSGQKSPPRKTRGRSNAVDAHVGSRLRQIRTLLGLSQEKLGNALDLTFQQIQKYERGTNRIGASRLYELSRVLDVPVSFFFDGLQSKGANSDAARYGLAEESAAFEDDPMTRRETLELVRAYYRIPDPALRRKLFDLAKSMASSFEDTGSDGEADK